MNNHIVDSQYITFFTDGNPANAQVRISKQFSIIVGDIVRVYRMTDYQNNWFKDLQSARENFASSVNAHFSKRHLVAKVSCIHVIYHVKENSVYFFVFCVI